MPKAVNLVLIAVLGVYAGISVVALSALPVVHTVHGYATELGTTYENDPVLGIIRHLGLHGTVLKLAQDYVGVLAATILFIATNAGLIGISRLSWSLAEHRQLPSIFSQLHPKFRTPWFTIVFFSIIAALLILPGETKLLGNLYSFGAMLSFTTAHVAVVALRVQGARPRAPLPDALERAHPRLGHPDDGRARRDRHVRARGARSSRCTARRARSASPG